MKEQAMKTQMGARLLAILFLVLSILPAAAHGPVDYAELYKEVSKSVVEVKDAEGGHGTGVIISSDGYILTNAHVIYDYETDQEADISVFLYDGREMDAEIIGYDHYSDIALLKINVAGHLFAAKIGDSDELHIGNVVLAIGHPHRFDYSLSSGVVSYLNRLVADYSQACSTPFIQTDAASNPGNSGGPLLNAEGEVVGIITWGEQDDTYGSGSIGIEFAVPINLAMQVQNKLRESMPIRWGMLGVYLDDEIYSVSSETTGGSVHGFLVNKVNKGSGAEAAGIKQGDVIIEYDNKIVNNLNDFPCLIAGTEVAIKVMRKGIAIPLTVTLGAIEDGGLIASLD